MSRLVTTTLSSAHAWHWMSRISWTVRNLCVTDGTTWHAILRSIAGTKFVPVWRLLYLFCRSRAETTLCAMPTRLQLLEPFPSVSGSSFTRRHRADCRRNMGSTLWYSISTRADMAVNPIKRRNHYYSAKGSYVIVTVCLSVILSVCLSVFHSVLRKG